jgi:hypothetical protein
MDLKASLDDTITPNLNWNHGENGQVSPAAPARDTQYVGGNLIDEMSNDVVPIQDAVGTSGGGNAPWSVPYAR